MHINNRLYAGSGWHLGAMLLGTMLVASCTEDTYDLDKEIDSSISIGEQGISLPASRVEPITMGTILDIDNYEDVSTVEAENLNDQMFKGMAVGDYYFSNYSDEPTESKVKVDGVKVKMTGSSKGESKKVYFQTFNGGGHYKQGQILELNTNLEITSNDVTYEIKEIKHLVAEGFVTHLALDYSPIGGSPAPKKLYLGKGTKFTFPEYLTLTDSKDFKVVEGQPNVIELLHETPMLRNQLCKLEMQIKSINCEGMTPGSKSGDWGLYVVGTSEEDKGKFQVNPTIDVTGWVYLNEDDLDYGVSNVDLTINSQVVYNASSSVEIKTVKGLFIPKDGYSLEPVNMTDLPDLLTDEKTHIIISDPRVTFTLSKDERMGDDLNVQLRNIKVTPMTVNEDGTTSDLTGNIITIKQMDAVTAHQLSTPIFISNDSDIEVAPGAPKKGLTQLMYDIPDQIKFDILQTEFSGTMDLNTEYKVKMEYKLVAPMRFEETSTIRYEETMDGMGSNIEDIDFDGLEAIMHYKNIIPMRLEIPADEIVVLGSDGNPINDVTVKLENGVIAAGTAEHPTDGNLRINITVNPGGSLSNFDGLKLTFVASVPDHEHVQTLNTKHTLEFDNIAISVKGGITLNP